MSRTVEMEVRFILPVADDQDADEVVNARLDHFATTLDDEIHVMKLTEKDNGKLVVSYTYRRPNKRS